MKAKNNKRFKGMTLVEIIISLAVVSIMSLLIVQASAAINKISMSANNVNRKVAQQAPVAEIKNVGNATPYSEGDNFNVHIDLYDCPSKEATSSNSKGEAEVGGTVYAVNGDVRTPDQDGYRAGDSLCMKFVVLKTTAATTTGAAATTTTTVTTTT